jgi:pyridoxamine 5'-phosphate oxidase
MDVTPVEFAGPTLKPQSQSQTDLADLRISYERGQLEDSSTSAEPHDLFAAWLEAALAEESIIEPYAMALSTVDTQSRPSSRIVLLRGYDARGFTFFTNYESRKGSELAANDRAAILFWWGALQRQIRIEGHVVKLAPAESDAYFGKRPRGHRLSAWASRQSTIVPDRATLDAEMAAADARFPGDDVPRPDYWGGYRLVASYFEFWQGRRSRVHDRLAFTRETAGWSIVRLSP